MFKTKTRTLHLKTKTFSWCILEADWKAFVIFSRKRKCRRKWNCIYSWKQNENGHSFSAEKRKWKSPDNINVFFYIQSPNTCISSHQVSPTMRRQYLVQFRLFCRWSLLTGISSCTVYRYICGIFVDDISTREQFAFLIYCYWVKAVFHNLCTMFYWRLCGLTNSPPC